MMTRKELNPTEDEFRQLPIEEPERTTFPEGIFKQMTDISLQPVIVTDKKGEIVYYNKAAAGFIEKKGGREDVITGREITSLSKYIYSLFPRDDLGFTSTTPIKIIDKYGDTRFLRLKESVLTCSINIYHCFQFTDLTEKILSEKALISSEKDKTLILNSIHENLVYYDRNFRIIWANQKPADSLGLKPEELKGKICHELWYGLDSPCSDCTVKKVLKSGKPLIEEKTKSKGRSIKVAAYPVFDDSGDIIGAVESVLDISRRKKAEKALDETMKNYMELFTTMTNGFVLHEIITDEEGRPSNFRFLDANPAFEEMTGLVSKDLIGKNVLDIFPDYNPKWIERYGRVALTGEPEEFSDYNRTLGKYYHIYSYSPKNGQFAAIFSDISDLVALKKEQDRLMMQINRNFEQLAILNDEIRNPLQIITGFAIMDDSASSDEIMSQIRVIDKLINELDKRWLESNKIREYLTKHHGFF
ncbi:MAG: PAS domain S-box protein [Methanomicrobiaceae archaeon]|nr:PAS domain S-box protein [Methanomicrobiaceae archaeon]